MQNSQNKLDSDDQNVQDLSKIDDDIIIKLKKCLLPSVTIIELIQFRKSMTNLLQEYLQQKQNSQLFSHTFLVYLLELSANKNIIFFVEILKLYLELLQIQFLNLQLYNQNENFISDSMNVLIDGYDMLKYTMISEKIRQQLIQLREYFAFDTSENLQNSVFIIDSIIIQEKEKNEQQNQIQLSNLIIKNDFKMQDILDVFKRMDSFQSQIQVIFYIKGICLNYWTFHFTTIIKRKSKNELHQICTNIYKRFLNFSRDFIVKMYFNNQNVKSYNLNYEIYILQNNYELFKISAQLLNHILLMPNDEQLQYKCFIIMRRLFILYPDHQEKMIKPFKVLFQNIALFCNDQKILKQTSIFLFQLQNKYNKQFNSEALSNLKINKYFSVKALSFPMEIDQYYNIRNLQIEFGFENYTVIKPQGQFSQNLFVSQQNTILYWSFQSQDYDIGFGIQYLNNFNQLQDQGENIFPIKRCDSIKKPLYGSIVVQRLGIYKIILDNSFSLMRSKKVNFNFHLMERKKVE